MEARQMTYYAQKYCCVECDHCWLVFGPDRYDTMVCPTCDQYTLPLATITLAFETLTIINDLFNEQTQKIFNEM